MENTPTLWQEHIPWPGPGDHKYTRGAALILGGPIECTGAARLAAKGAQRLCGLVAIACDESAAFIYAPALEAVMMRLFEGREEFEALLQEKKYSAFLAGPGNGVGEGTKGHALAMLNTGKPVVLDADALTSFAGFPERLAEAANGQVILTPHEGEFVRLFGGEITMENRQRRAAIAAEATGCVVLLKGHRTVIAAPDGRLAVTADAPAWLATAGSGDVLAGMCTALLAGGVPAFEAACMASWMHASAAKLAGPGLIAEDLPAHLPQVLRQLSF